MDNKEVNSIGKYVYQVIIGISVIFSTLVYFLKDNNASKDRENTYLKNQILIKDSTYNSNLEKRENKVRIYIMLRTQLEAKQKLTDLDSLIINN